MANQGSDNVSVLIGGAGLAFVGPINLPAGDGPSSVAVGDFNADDRPDLAVTNELVDNVSILLGTTPTAIHGPRAHRRSGSPSFPPTTRARRPARTGPTGRPSSTRHATRRFRAPAS